MTSKVYIDNSPFSSENCKVQLAVAEKSLDHLNKIKSEGKEIVQDIDMHIKQFESQILLFKDIISGKTIFVPDEKH
jgi:hypothetical protein